MRYVWLLFLTSPAWAQNIPQHWYDGQAELNGYQLTQPRYGELRRGQVVHIYVTEPFSQSARVKADPGQHPDSDVFQVMKLNVAKDFQTGIYDYNTMTSVFVAMDPQSGQRAGTPTKLTYSAQEWCGMVFEELLFDPGQIRQKRFSYFDGEADTDAKLSYPPGGITVDELPILVRGLPAAYLAPGEERRLKILGSVERSRLLHHPLTWQDGTLARAKTSQTLTVPGGNFKVEVWTATFGQEKYEYFVETQFPHRLVGWNGPDGEQARLTGSARLKYWSLNREGAEKYLEQIGLSPQAR